MDKDLEKAKENAYQKMLDKRVKFLLPDNLKCKQLEDEDKCYKVSDYDNIECENEDVCEVELNKFHVEFTADIETRVELNHIETFTNENDIKKEICEKITNTIYRSTFYQINLKEDNIDLVNKIQLKELETDSTTNDIKTYSVLIKDVLFEIGYYDDEILSSLNKSIIRLCERINIENDIDITNIKFIDPKFNTEE